MLQPSKIASGPTGIQRQLGKVKAKPPNAKAVAAAKAAVKGKPRKALKRPPRAAKRAKTAKRVKRTSPPKGDGKTKRALVGEMLLRPAGTTREEILKATEWPSVTVPGVAKALKLKLRQEKVKGERTRYFATAA